VRLGVEGKLSRYRLLRPDGGKNEDGFPQCIVMKSVSPAGNPGTKTLQNAGASCNSHDARVASGQLPAKIHWHFHSWRKSIARLSLKSQ